MDTLHSVTAFFTKNGRWPAEKEPHGGWLHDLCTYKNMCSAKIAVLNGVDGWQWQERNSVHRTETPMMAKKSANSTETPTKKKERANKWKDEKRVHRREPPEQKKKSANKTESPKKKKKSAKK